jgi:hypothetical protein
VCQHLGRLVVVEVRPRRRDPVENQADRQYGQEHVQQQPGDQDDGEQRHVERLR